MHVGQAISINSLPGDILLAIFDSYLYEIQSIEERTQAWQSLIHVCRRWRSIVFGSPRHLKLQLVCANRTPTRDTLDVWPALPLIVICNYAAGSADDIVAVLERSDRVYQIYLIYIWGSDLERFLSAMQVPFPELTVMELRMSNKAVAVLPDSFLGGSAPRLESLKLDGIPFPGLAKLLLSATHLVDLHLEDIPHSGYISPEEMVTALSMLSSLTSLMLYFRSPRSCPDQASRRPPPSTRTVLPVFSTFRFKGASEYLEDLVICVDAPQLNALSVTFFNDIAFDTPQFIQFINRTPTSRTLEKAHIALGDGTASVNFLSRTPSYGELHVEISCRELDWQVSSLEQVCASCLPPLSMLQDLYIYTHSQQHWKDNVENGLWLELLNPFTSVENLYLSEELASRIGPALQELVVGGTTEVLPTLQNMFLEGLESSGAVQESIGQFVSARQVVGHPIAVSRWADSEEEMVY
jgi:hypothetical protein